MARVPTTSLYYVKEGTVGMEPLEYHVTTTINDAVVGEFRKPIPDPFARTEVTVARRDLRRLLLRGKRLTVTVNVDGTPDALWRHFGVSP